MPHDLFDKSTLVQVITCLIRQCSIAFQTNDYQILCHDFFFTKLDRSFIGYLRKALKITKY